VQGLDEYLAALASEAPAPGGGSAAMVVAAAGCSLVAMVARICAASRRYETVRELAVRLVAEADALRGRLLELRFKDEAAYGAVVASRGDSGTMQLALRGAAAVPLEGARASLRLAQLTCDALDLHNANLISDVGCAAEFAYAALTACAYNVRINHKFLKNDESLPEQASELAALESQGTERLHAVREAVRIAFL
jgi:formiminotetrahydrofolate cyclodeaminase